ncbi:GNAT family N-acetyltransferase [Algibacter sp. PT7-4]|uniref:GNAT family N-acetyltransferase n=1 Tax=Algibacter ulvanivorans TaxID=3400999 RepID=UPI003AAAFAEF
MEENNTPFLTKTFQNIWRKHFISNKTIQTFKFIDGVNFYKNNFRIYTNIGKNLTKGNIYNLIHENDYKNTTLLIYDVLPHLTKKQNTNNTQKNIGVLKSKQYTGFLIQLDKFKSIDDYLLNTFSKNTRMKMRKFNKRLETCFNISTKMFFGHIEKQEYDFIFENFMALLQKRYSEKEISYNNMQPKEWNFYKDVAYPLILEKKASLFIIYNNNTPIAVTYNYHTQDSVIDAITVYDTNYSKFNIGYVNNLKLISWCFDNKIKTLDFSKGYFDYKKRMSTLEYDFEYHILYDKASIVSKIKAFGYYNFFKIKAYLRNKDYNSKFHKISYKLKNKSAPKENFEIIKLAKLPESYLLNRIDIMDNTKYNFLKRHVNNFLYLIVKPYNQIQLFEVKNINNTYILSSNSLIQQLTFTN